MIIFNILLIFCNHKKGKNHQNHLNQFNPGQKKILVRNLPVAAFVIILTAIFQ